MRSALILGGANCLEQDKAGALELFTPDLIIACNHAGRDEPGRVDHWATMHPEQFDRWVRQRREAGHPDAGQLWRAAHRRPIALDTLPIDSWGGSSGFLCVRLAIHLGCDRIVLAGVPMRKTFEHYDRPGQWTEARLYHSVWRARLRAIKDKVRSQSGWTAELLGFPTKEWFDGQ